MEETAIQAILGNQIRPGTIIIIRNEGPKGGPGMARDAGRNIGTCWHGIGRELRIGDRSGASQEQHMVQPSDMLPKLYAVAQSVWYKTVTASRSIWQLVF